MKVPITIFLFSHMIEASPNEHFFFDLNNTRFFNDCSKSSDPMLFSRPTRPANKRAGRLIGSPRDQLCDVESPSSFGSP